MNLTFSLLLLCCRRWNTKLDLLCSYTQDLPKLVTSLVGQIIMSFRLDFPNKTTTFLLPSPECGPVRKQRKAMKLAGQARSQNTDRWGNTSRQKPTVAIQSSSSSRSSKRVRELMTVDTVPHLADTLAVPIALQTTEQGTGMWPSYGGFSAHPDVAFDTDVPTIKRRRSNAMVDTYLPTVDIATLGNESNYASSDVALSYDSALWLDDRSAMLDDDTFPNLWGSCDSALSISPRSLNKSLGGHPVHAQLACSLRSAPEQQAVSPLLHSPCGQGDMATEPISIPSLLMLSPETSSLSPRPAMLRPRFSVSPASLPIAARTDSLMSPGPLSRFPCSPLSEAFSETFCRVATLSFNLGD